MILRVLERVLAAVSAYVLNVSLKGWQVRKPFHCILALCTLSRARTILDAASSHTLYSHGVGSISVLSHLFLEILHLSLSTDNEISFSGTKQAYEFRH